MKKKHLKDILFLDIETASGVPAYDDLSQRMQAQWSIKARKISRDHALSEDEIINLYKDRAGIFAEFSKIVCISVGYLDFKKNDEVVLKIKSFKGDDEIELLNDFCSLLNRHFDNPDRDYLCGHNIREFDIPVICRRLVIHGIELPKILNIAGKKPWQVTQILDTLEMWKFGDYKNYISLDLLSAVLGYSSPKDDMDGSMVSQVYWHDKGLDRIAEYCQQDVVILAKCFLKMVRQDPIDDVIFIT